MGSSKVRGVGSKVLVTVDEKKIKEFEVKATPDKRDDYQIPLRLKAGKRKIRVDFTNDESTKGSDGKTGEDRNLFIYSVKVTGQKKGILSQLQNSQPATPRSSPSNQEVTSAMKMHLKKCLPRWPAACTADQLFPMRSIDWSSYPIP